jgi:hypothetical protein
MLHLLTWDTDRQTHQSISASLGQWPTEISRKSDVTIAHETRAHPRFNGYGISEHFWCVLLSYERGRIHSTPCSNAAHVYAPNKLSHQCIVGVANIPLDSRR